MAKNYIQDVAKILGVELDEEFNVEERGKTIFKLTEKGLFSLDMIFGWIKHNESVFTALLYGELVIKKLPWKPKKNDMYYKPSEKFSHAVLMRWNDTPWDFAYQETGMVFRTAEECEAALPELRKKYLGGDDNV